MNTIKVRLRDCDGNVYEESLHSYCLKLSKKNNSILYKLEDYLGTKLLENENLAEIRDIILSVSAEVSKINQIVVVDGDNDEKLQ